MSKNRRAAKIDGNEKAIRDALIDIPGVSVAPGHDDILVGYRGRNFWFEIKSLDCANKKGQVFESAKKDSQKQLEKYWTGHYQIVTTVDEILHSIMGVKIEV